MNLRNTFMLAAALLGASASASTIIGPAGQNAGATSTAFSVFDAQTGTLLTGSSATATFNIGAASFNVGCTFIGNICTANLVPGLNLLGSFTVTAPAGDTQGVWTIANQAGLGLGFLRMSALALDLTLSDSAFNPCLSSGIPNISSIGCSAVTPGAGGALSASTAPGGTAGIQATVIYSDAISNANGDLFGQLKLNFRGTNFITNNSFTFQVDTDYIGPGPEGLTENPEPATISLTGAALVLLGWSRRKQIGNLRF